MACQSAETSKSQTINLEKIISTATFASVYTQLYVPCTQRKKEIRKQHERWRHKTAVPLHFYIKNMAVRFLNSDENTYDNHPYFEY
ncbi:hypothetical protein B7P43_G03558 [Cryptotermes secundus]|uniref:Uncharacterized protein n=1 Tax=Cryptotermes secundus TaxID=105785 RepID=A0A2J7PCG6_9NEOP|nr:hypothetical protein B7P43_G03558 [Cryptotermes secundus]